MGDLMIFAPEARGTVEPTRKIANGRPVEAAGAMDAQNAPTAPWKPQNGFHKLPQGPSLLMRIEGKNRKR